MAQLTFAPARPEEILLPVKSWFVVLTLAIGFLCNLLPLYGAALAVRPDFLALVLLYWCIREPRLISVGIAWCLGLLMDVADATVLGQPITTVPLDCGASAVNSACLTASQFSSTETTFGTVPRNSFRGPGYFNTDLGLKKSFRLNERLSFTLGANAYNILNHPNFANPVSDLSSSAFGTIINAVQPPTSPYGAFAAAATDARIVQVMGRINF